MDIYEKLKKEEEEAEKEFYGKETEAGKPEDGALDEVDLNEVPVDVESELEGPAKEEPKDKRRISWKQRFTSYKATNDLALHQARVKIAALEAENERLTVELTKVRSKIAELKKAARQKKDPFEGVIDEKDVELLGPEAIEVMKKYALAGMENSGDKEEIETLRAQLHEVQVKQVKAAKESSDKLATENEDAFKIKLMLAVENFNDIDLDPKFSEYLEGVDEASGQPRLHLYRQAIQSRDVLGVARFYNEYRGRRPKTREEILEEQVVPEGDAAGPTQTQQLDENAGKKKYHISEYEAFYDDLNKGVWKGREKEADKLMRMYDKAYLEDRLYE